jgi:hypothetical protein
VQTVALALVSCLVSCLVVAVALVTLVGQAVRGDRVVTSQLSARAVHDASVDDAFYRCIDVQAHSLVPPGRSVTLRTDNLADVVTMIKGFGSWVEVADPASRADIFLTLRDDVPGPGTCLGTQVVATRRGPDGRTEVRVGTGAQVSGHGPPPAPPL